MSEEGHERKKRQRRAEERPHRKRGPPETSESTESEEVPLVRKRMSRKEHSEATAEEQDAAMGRLDEADLHRPLDVLPAPHQPDLRFEELQAPLLEVIPANPRTEPKRMTEIDQAQALVASHSAIAGKFLIGILRRILLSEAFNLLSGPHAVEERAYLMGVAEWARHERSDPAGKDIDFFVGQWSSKIAKRPRPAQSFGQWQYGVSAVLTGGRVEQELAAIARDTAQWLDKPLTFPPFLRSELRKVKPREIQVPAKPHKTRESVLVLADWELASAACPFPRKGLKSEGEQTVEGAQSAGRTDSQTPSFVDVVRRRESSGGGRGRGARAPTPKKQKTGATEGAQGGEAESARARRRQSRGEKSREESGGEMEGAGQGPAATVMTEEPAEENENNMLRAWEVAKSSAEDEWLRRARADKVKRFGTRSDRGGKFVEEIQKDGVWCKIQRIEGTQEKWESAGIEIPQLQLRVHGFLRNILWGEPVAERFALFMPDEFFSQYVDGTTVSDLGLVELEQLALDGTLQEWERSANRGVLFQWGMLNDPNQLYSPRTVSLSAFQCSSRDEELDSAFHDVDLTIPAAVIEQIVFDRRKEPRWTKDRVRNRNEEGEAEEVRPGSGTGAVELKSPPPGSATLEEAQLKSPRTPSKSPAKASGGTERKKAEPEIKVSGGKKGLDESGPERKQVETGKKVEKGAEPKGPAPETVVILEVGKTEARTEPKGGPPEQRKALGEVQKSEMSADIPGGDLETALADLNAKEEAEYEKAQEQEKTDREEERKRKDAEEEERKREAEEVATAWAKGLDHAGIALGESAFEPDLPPSTEAEKQAYIKEAAGGSGGGKLERPKGALVFGGLAADQGREDAVKAPIAPTAEAAAGDTSPGATALSGRPFLVSDGGIPLDGGVPVGGAASTEAPDLDPDKFTGMAFEEGLGGEAEEAAAALENVRGIVVPSLGVPETRTGQDQFESGGALTERRNDTAPSPSSSRRGGRGPVTAYPLLGSVTHYVSRRSGMMAIQRFVDGQITVSMVPLGRYMRGAEFSQPTTVHFVKGVPRGFFQRSAEACESDESE
ncbi:hypothetical protein KFL_003280110 [Klebsormidium nitens]|uniref:Uncharacterized protein n=1 Tax=Klebsormidium nitens TaxID=105231 RepID=A0A1Y1IEB5_KLENI|nr:hypothetical protein KFL_003280110 [Klebsormidium nitens]|eukprot:GAQ87057.1 hypothetical protein KFL_003280110 [Klebsormidium nitens]